MAVVLDQGALETEKDPEFEDVANETVLLNETSVFRPASIATATICGEVSPAFILNCGVVITSWVAPAPDVIVSA